MAAPVKRRELDLQKNEKPSDSESSGAEDDNESGPESEYGEIEVEFEGRNPQDPDYHGIKCLLQQLFVKAHLDLSGLTDLIISQNYIGSVIKQTQEDEISDDEDDYTNVFGITTVINVSDRQNVKCIQQLRDLLKQLANEHATDSTNSMIKNVLENDSSALGLLIHERIVNIPAQISVPLLENLLLEMKRAVKKKMAFDFSYYILICKLYKTNEDNQKKKNKSKKKKNASEEPDIIWSNPEEEIIAEEATCSFEFSIETESDNGLSGLWTEDDNEMVPYRRVLLFESSKLPGIIDKIKTQLAS